MASARSSSTQPAAISAMTMIATNRVPAERWTGVDGMGGMMMPRAPHLCRICRQVHPWRRKRAAYVIVRSYPALLVLLVLGIIVVAPVLYQFIFPGGPHTILHTGP